MNMQFGLCNFAGEPVSPETVSRVKSVLHLVPSAGQGEFLDHEIYMLSRHADLEAGTQPPLRSATGAVLCWDGRLDNRSELAGEFGDDRLCTACDAEVAATAFDKWGTRAFGELRGDWALSLWDPKERRVILAKDFLGARPLYYSTREGSVRWSNLLDPLILTTPSPPPLHEEYIAGWFSRFPSTRLTPYAGIHAVPPSCFVVLRDGQEMVRTHWEFDPGKRIAYRNAKDYEPHFRDVFKTSVRRRLRSTAPILAELSGGMDSSAIVCMADQIISEGEAETTELDTISYYDDGEANWDEGRYFEIVEQRRGKSGLHVPVDFHNDLHPKFPIAYFAATPGSASGCDDSLACTELESGRYRVLLQGIGGDEVLGGIPAASPELADLLASGRAFSFTKRLLMWALALRAPVFQLGVEAICELLAIPNRPSGSSAFPWLRPEFVRRNRRALAGYPSSVGCVFKGRPSFRANLAALEDLRRHINTVAASSVRERFERRYPYLDRDLLEFLYAIPREQLIRPGQRRSLMRRALVGLLPEEVLNRKRKAFLARAPVVALQTELPRLVLGTKTMLASELGIVDRSKFQESLRRVTEGRADPVIPLLRTLLVEAWLRHVSQWTTCCDVPLFPRESAKSRLYTCRDAQSSLS